MIIVPLWEFLFSSSFHIHTVLIYHWCVHTSRVCKIVRGKMTLFDTYTNDWSFQAYKENIFWRDMGRNIYMFKWIQIFLLPNVSWFSWHWCGTYIYMCVCVCVCVCLMKDRQLFVIPQSSKDSFIFIFHIHIPYQLHSLFHNIILSQIYIG